MNIPRLLLILFLLVIVWYLRLHADDTRQGNETGLRSSINADDDSDDRTRSINEHSGHTERPDSRTLVLLYLSVMGGKILNENTIMENQTWNGVTTEYQDEVRKRIFPWDMEKREYQSLLADIIDNP